MLNITQKIVPSSKYSIKCPYTMDWQYITIHNTAGDASANNEIAYMTSNNKETSFHFAVDDVSIIQGLPLDRNGWHAGDGNGTGNRKSIGVEICYSKSGGDRFVKAMQNAAELTAYLLHQKGFGIDRVKKHQDWSKKNCPHRILSDYGWQWYLNLIQQYYNGSTPNITVTPTISPVRQDNLNTILPTYQTWDDVKNCWLPNVIGTSDYAGIFGHDICAVYANLSEGNITYKVHQQGGNWLPAVVNRSDYAGIFNKPIDAIAMTTDTGCTLHYKVHIRGGSWLGDVTGYDTNDNNNGYAGIIGKPIDGLQIWLDPKPVPTPVVTETPKVIQPYGYTDSATQDIITGWAYNGKDDTPVEVHIYISKDGQDVKCYSGVIANNYREDLKSAGIGNGSHGFIFEHDLYSDLGKGEFTARAYAIGKNNPQLNQTVTFTISEKVVEAPIIKESEPATVVEDNIQDDKQEAITTPDEVTDTVVEETKAGEETADVVKGDSQNNTSNSVLENILNVLKQILDILGKIFKK